jgi:hypothetical protein
MLGDEDADDKFNRELQFELNSFKEKNREAKMRLADQERRRSDAIGQLRVL